MSSRISRLIGRVGRVTFRAALGTVISASSASGQAISLGGLGQTKEHDLSMALSCGTVSFELPQSPDAVVDRYFAYQTRTRSAPNDVEPLHMAFLLRPPYACTPRVDALYSLSLDELAALTDVEFAEFGLRLIPNRAERVGNYEQRKEFDRRAERAKEKFASLRTLLRERRFDDAHDLLDELNPGRPEANLLGLAQALLNSTDREAQQYGRRSLHRIEGNDPVVAFDAHLLAGAVALKERRWADAELHYNHVAESLSKSDVLMPEEESNRRRRETYLSLAYVSERRGNYARAHNDIDLAIALDPYDRTAWLHSMAMTLMKLGPPYPGRSARFVEARKWFREYYPAVLERSGTPSSHLAGAVELQLVDLELQAFGYSPQLLEQWEKTADELAAKGLPPEVEAQVRLKSAELLAAGSKFAEAAEKLAAAEKLDRTNVVAAPQWPALLFTLSDARAVKLFGDRFFVDPADHESGRMLSLALLDSADARERSRGAAIAELLYQRNRDSVPLIVAAASAHFMHGRNEEAFRLVEPLFGIRQPTSWETKVGHVPGDVRRYVIDARAFSPFDPEHLTKVWLVTQAGDALEHERQELNKSPLAVESSEAAPPPLPATLSADDAYLVARILFRVSDAKSPERITQALALLERIVHAPEPMRYRVAAERLRADVSKQATQSLHLPLSGTPTLLPRAPIEIRDFSLPAALQKQRAEYDFR